MVLFLISVFLITGGRGVDYAGYAVEVFSASGARLPCSVPPFPLQRYQHTQDGEVACGGSGSGYYSCDSLTASGWTTSHQLVSPRHRHVSWRSPDGLLLMGGEYSLQTTELLTDTSSSSSPSFDLEYDTR